MSSVTFSIARNFSPNPGPRKIRQGSNSGELLRRKLVAFLERNPDAVVEIDLDGTKGIGSSFLDEAFGGLVRYEKKEKQDLLRRLKFKSTIDPSYVDDIVDSISRAQPEPAQAVHAASG